MLDNLERALAYRRRERRRLRGGVQADAQAVSRPCSAGEGVKSIDVKGKPFDPQDRRSDRYASRQTASPTTPSSKWPQKGYTHRRRFAASGKGDRRARIALEMNYKDYYRFSAFPRSAPRKTSSPHIANSRASGIPTRTRTTPKKPRRSSRRSPRRTKFWAIRKSGSKYDVLGRDWQQAARKPSSSGAIASAERNVQSSTSAISAARRGAGGGRADSPISSTCSSRASAAVNDARRAPASRSAGQDLETTIELTLRDVYDGGKKVRLAADRRSSVPAATEPEPNADSSARSATAPDACLRTRSSKSRFPKASAKGSASGLRGQGGAGVNGGPNGDLFLDRAIWSTIPTYKRKGDDLYVDLPVSIYDLVLGGEVNVPTLGGQVAMTIPPARKTTACCGYPDEACRKVRNGGAGRSIRPPDRPAPDRSQREREKTLQGTRRICTTARSRPRRRRARPKAR